MRSWWHAYVVCGAIILVGAVVGAFSHDQFADLKRQRQMLIDNGSPLAATVTFVGQETVSYEYRLNGAKHYGSTGKWLGLSGAAVGSQIEIIVSPTDPDISAFQPERQPKFGRSTPSTGRWIEFAGLGSLLVIVGLDVRRRRTSG